MWRPCVHIWHQSFFLPTPFIPFYSRKVSKTFPSGLWPLWIVPSQDRVIFDLFRRDVDPDDIQLSRTCCTLTKCTNAADHQHKRYHVTHLPQQLLLKHQPSKHRGHFLKITHSWLWHVGCEMEGESWGKYLFAAFINPLLLFGNLKNRSHLVW